MNVLFNYQSATLQVEKKIYGTNLNLLLMFMLSTAIVFHTFFDTLLLKIEDDWLSGYFSSTSMKGRRISQLTSVVIYLSLVIPLFLQRFQVQKFCLMNPGENICNKHTQSCFSDKIPRFFDYDGHINTFCAFVFPPGFSIHIENFNIDQPGPDNVVLLESENMAEKKLSYHSRVEWANRLQRYWKKLPDSHQLSNKHIRRGNIQCVKSLKVKCFLILIYN